jgi:hypothetical protein
MNARSDSDWLIWKPVYREGFCVCTTLLGYEESHKLKRGASAALEFPQDAQFAMDPDFPDDIKLADNIRNTGGFILASKPLKQIIEPEVGADVEYLPVKIINHKGRLASSDYFIINPLSIYDAIDFTQSVVKRNNINPDAIASVTKLVIDPLRVPQNATVFRLKSFERRVLVHREIADRLSRTGLSGIGFQDAAEFRGF